MQQWHVFQILINVAYMTRLATNKHLNKESNELEAHHKVGTSVVTISSLLKIYSIISSMGKISHVAIGPIKDKGNDSNNKKKKLTQEDY